MAEEPVAILRGEIGLLKSEISAAQIAFLKSKLTLRTTPYKGIDPETVYCYHEDNDRIWMPRHFAQGYLWRLVDQWDWSVGEPFTFEANGSPDPERGQVETLRVMPNYLKQHKAGVLISPTGTGKCLGLGTKVIKADGSVIPVEDIQTGDRLMGPDGKARVVLSTTTGRGQLFQITPIKGEPWVCNDVHVLTLIHTQKNTVIDVSLDEWRTSTKNFRHLHKQFTCRIDTFEGEPLEPELDPYFLGVWFGDGTKKKVNGQVSCVSVTKPDREIRDVCQEVASSHGLQMREVIDSRSLCSTYFVTRGNERPRQPNPVLNKLRGLVGSDLQVPDSVLCGSRDVRLGFLAGFLDTDGHLDTNCFEIIQKREDWARAVWWIARSLGLGATITPKEVPGFGTFFRVMISGDTDMIPTRIPRKQATKRKQIKDATRTGFDATPIGEGDYYGFTLDGDGRFLLGDFTVTHNTFLACHIAANLGRFVGWFAYAGHMVDNATEHAKAILGLRDDQIGIVQGDRCDLGRPFTIMMIQSLLKRTYPDELYQQIGLLVGDEIQRYGAQEWRKVVARFPAKFRLGMSADPARSDGLGDIITWTFGRVGHEAERIRSADVKPPSVIGVSWTKKYSPTSFCTWIKDGDSWREGEPHPTKFDKKLSKDNERTKMYSGEIANAAVSGRNILVFARMVAHLKTCKKLVDIDLDHRGLIPSTGLLIGGKGSAKKKKADREEAVKAQVIFTTFAMARDALNIPKLDTMFFLTPPGNALQPIGRLREKSEGIDRKSLLVVDGYENCDYSRKKFRRRLRQYESLGIPVKVVRRSPS